MDEPDLLRSHYGIDLQVCVCESECPLTIKLPPLPLYTVHDLFVALSCLCHTLNKLSSSDTI